MKHLLLTLISLLVFNLGHSQRRIDYSNYNQHLTEAFDYQDLTRLSNNWNLVPANPNHGAGTEIYDATQVSLLPEGGIRLTATPLASPIQINQRTIHYKSGMISRQLEVAHGIFEIIAQFPNGKADIQDAWPVFKLVGNEVELTIFDGRHNINDDLRQHVSIPGHADNTRFLCGGVWDLEDFHSHWEDNVHVFQAAWSPESITFFIHGRERFTVTKEELNVPIESLNLVVALQTNETSDESIHFDIQKINVFKPKSATYQTYLYDEAWVFHHVTGPNQLAEKSVIIPNPQNANQVLFEAVDGTMMVANLQNGHWDSRQANTIETLWKSQADANQSIQPFLTHMNANMMLVNQTGLPETLQKGYITDIHFPKGEGLAYRGDNDQLNFLIKKGNAYHHQMPAYQYGRDANHPDLIASNIVWDGVNNRVLYLGEDGRLQFFVWDEGLEKWRHNWINDYWFTEAYLAETGKDGLLAKGADEKIFFRTQDGGLAYFNWEKTQADCQCETIHTNQKGATLGDISLDVFPNPTIDKVTVTLAEKSLDISQYALYAADGQLVQSGQLGSYSHEIDLTNLAAGAYQLSITNGDRTFSERVIKQK